MYNYELKIKAVSQIPLDIRCRIVAQYCKEYQIVTTEKNNFSGFDDNIFTLKEHKEVPAAIELADYAQKYWVRCHKAKTSYVFDIWYRSW
jgi:hypothetical protein